MRTALSKRRPIIAVMISAMVLSPSAPASADDGPKIEIEDERDKYKFKYEDERCEFEYEFEYEDGKEEVEREGDCRHVEHLIRRHGPRGFAARGPLELKRWRAFPPRGDQDFWGSDALDRDAEAPPAWREEIRPRRRDSDRYT